MQQLLDVAYVDTVAAQLSLSLDHEPLPALAELVVGREHPADAGTPSVAVSLRLLGASHQVTVSDAAGQLLLIETVACLAGAAAGLPPQAAGHRLVPGYRFRSSVRRDPQAVTRVADELSKRFRDDDRSLVGHYGSDPAAVTAITADPHRPDRLGWQSWHTYPQSGEIVYTRSTMPVPCPSGTNAR